MGKLAITMSWGSWIHNPHDIEQSRAEPELHNLGDDIDNDALMSKCTSVGRMVCGMEIDFPQVFDMILQVAVDGNLRPDQMDKKVFVLTRLENFDRAGGSCWESDYEALQKNLK
ncbi:uncharacterized protein Pyn_02877 [Prunus yedoensis var. nudiflora]|uniref:DUF7788 domain-containing protein n=1 Tax=Prunus yedoensis var. nudiflora TaxID=2094558 RepID=A0A314YNF8_PRUYE|nr:uncharacterized protein Pyn_02877 [Prunus yedoensis var. nudiflora]